MARKPKKKHGEEEAGEAWLLPYSDLMTLLLAVFIVLFAVSQIDENKAKAFAEEFRNGILTGSESVLPEDGQSVVPPVIAETQASPQTQVEEFLGKTEMSNLNELKAEIDAIFESEGITSDVSTSIDKRGLVITFNNAILFESGSAEILTEHESTLLQVGSVISSLDNYIRIEGHTDNIPISSAVYPSNWELSTARASSVVRLFVDKSNMPPDKVVAVGYGEYKPIADNSTAEGRAKNRRVDIIVLSEQYNNLEQ